MIRQRSARQPSKTHNRAGCPYRDQTGKDAVLDWAGVLAGIDLPALPAELQVELQQLRLRYAIADLPGAAHS